MTTRIDCSQFPAQQMAIKSCLEALSCTLENNPVATLQAQLNFAAKSGNTIGTKVAMHNACFMSALGFLFAAAQKTLPSLPALPTIPDIGSALPVIPSIPDVPSTPGITITFAPDGITPLTIDF